MTQLRARVARTGGGGHDEAAASGPMNDILRGGKPWPLVKPIAEEVSLLDHLRQIAALPPPR